MSFGPLFRPFNHPKLELADQRDDEYGGSLVKRTRFAGRIGRALIANPDWPRRIRNGDSLQACCKNMLTELV